MFYRFLRYVNGNETEKKVTLKNFQMRLANYLRESYNTDESIIPKFYWKNIGGITSLTAYFFYLRNKGCK